MASSGTGGLTVSLALLVEFLLGKRWLGMVTNEGVA
jgi:RecA-family ATPase